MGVRVPTLMATLRGTQAVVVRAGRKPLDLKGLGNVWNDPEPGRSSSSPNPGDEMKRSIRPSPSPPAPSSDRLRQRRTRHPAPRATSHAVGAYLATMGLQRLPHPVEDGEGPGDMTGLTGHRRTGLPPTGSGRPWIGRWPPTPRSPGPGRELPPTDARHERPASATGPRTVHPRCAREAPGGGRAILPPMPFHARATDRTRHFAYLRRSAGEEHVPSRWPPSK
jgi:hypothetical protein